jgi:glycosyltransferase involved in cell wall biosynthesis
LITVDVSSFFSAGGGGGIRAYYEAKARWLTELDVECHFVVPGPRNSAERWGGGWLHRIAGPPLASGYRAFGNVAELRRVVREIDPEIVELASHYVLPQLITRACPRAAVVGFYHSDFPTAYVAPATERLPRLVGRAATAAAWWLVNLQHRRYRATLTGSQTVAARLVAAQVPHVRWVGLGVDPAICAAPLNALRHGRVGYLGRLTADKEIALVLAAAPAIMRTTGARIAIAGDGPARHHVRAAARRGLVDAIGPLRRGEVAGFLRGLDALIVPGRYETFSLATAEALAVGTPVIAAGQGGSGELVARSGGGATFAPGSAAALADAVRALLALRPAEVAALRARGRSHIAALYTWPRVMARVRSVHELVLREWRCSS